MTEPRPRKRRYPGIGLVAVLAGVLILGLALRASSRGGDGGGGASDERRSICATVARHATRSVPVQATVRALDEARGEATVTEKARAERADGSAVTTVSATVRATATLPQSSVVTVRRNLRRRGRGSARVCVDSGGRSAARRQASAQALAGAVERADRNLTRAAPRARRRVSALAKARAGADARRKAADAQPRANARAAASARRSAARRARQRADELAARPGVGGSEPQR